VLQTKTGKEVLVTLNDRITKKYIALGIFIFAGSAFNVLNAQGFIESLNDSIIKYKAGDH